MFIGVANRLNFFSNHLFVIVGHERLLQGHLQADRKSQLWNLISSVLFHHEAIGIAGLFLFFLSDPFRLATGQARTLAYLQTDHKFKVLIYCPLLILFYGVKR
jgi:hypothetical protein